LTGKVHGRIVVKGGRTTAQLNLYQNSAIAKDQDGIVIFGGGHLGCAKNPETKNDLHVKCNLGNNMVIDFNRNTWPASVRGGAYFFLPGIKALRYLATLDDVH
jgi:hypothetical protein